MTIPIARHVRLKNASLAEGEEDSIVLRGALDMDTISALLLDITYQRHKLSTAEINKIYRDLKARKLPPDIVLGMRGEKHKEGANGVWTLLDDVYIVDGQQRIEAVKLCLAEGFIPRLGAMVHFGTNSAWEAKKFKILNTTQTKVAPALLIRNEARDLPFVAMLLSMCEKDVKFPLAGRVCWNQRMQKGHIFRSGALVKSIGYLHSHMGISYTKAALPLCEDLQELCDRIGRNVIRENIRELYTTIDNCWGISTIALHGAVFMRGTFLSTMCKVLSDHAAFWQGNSLVVSKQNFNKWRTFPVNDPTVKDWAGTGTKVHPRLAAMMIDHLNRGKRVGRLEKRKSAEEDEAKPSVIKMQRAAKKKKTGTD